MMRIHEVLAEEAIAAISPQQANDGEMFGPLYHGTTGDLAQIIAQGFDVSKSVPIGIEGWRDRPVGTSNGYAFEPYGQTGVAAPVHHLGFGVYLTTVKAIAKQFSGGTTKGMRTFYLDSTRVMTINFGSPNTMMRWWRSQGYDMSIEDTKARNVRAWIAATMKLTINLKKDYDAVWFKGKSMYRLLDGDQICVYRPELLRVIDPTLAGAMEIGAKVVHTQVIPERYRGSNRFYVDEPKPDDFGKASQFAGKGWRGIYRADEEPPPSFARRYPVHWIPPPGMVGVITRHPFGEKSPQWYTVKWKNGGEMFNYAPEELKPAK